MIAQKRPAMIIESNDLAEPKVLSADTSVNKKSLVKEIEFFSHASSLSNIKDDLLMTQKVEKIKSKVACILTQIKSVLDEGDERNLQKLFVFICQVVEDYLHMKDKKKCNALKKQVVCELMLPYVKDEQLIGSIIKMVMPSIKKSTTYRRNKKNVSKLFFFVLSMVRNH